MAIDTDQLLTRGVAEIIVESELRAKLGSGKKLRLKMGFDPSSPNLHLGHAGGPHGSLGGVVMPEPPP